MIEPQTLKRTIRKYLDLRVKWRDKQFKAIINSGVIKNHIAPKTVEWLGLPHQQKEKPYILVSVLKDPVPYREGIINLETGLV